MRPARKLFGNGNPSGPWLTVAQLVDYLTLPSEGAVRELERRGVLPGHRLGGSLRFSRPEIDAMLARSRQGSLDELASGGVEVHVPLAGLGPFLSPEQAAAYLGLPSTDAVNHRVRRGELPVYRVGKQLRFRSIELDASMRSRRRSEPRAFLASQPLTHDRALRRDGETGRPFAEGKGGK